MRPGPADSSARRFGLHLRRLARDRRSSSTTIADGLLGEVERYLGGSADLPRAMVLQRVDRALAGVAAGQPSLVIVQSTVLRLSAATRRARRETPSTAALEELLREVRALRGELASVRKAVGRSAARLFPVRRSVLTMSYSTEVFEALRRADRLGRLGRVLVGETGGRCEGRRIVHDLRRRGIDARPLPLGQLPSALRQVDLAIVGADSVEPDGSVVSKAGTYLIALACGQSGTPFYATASSWKFRVDRPYERRPGRREPPPGLGLDRTGERGGALFDLTPRRLVTGYVTDRGLRRTGRSRSSPPRRREKSASSKRPA